MPSEAANARSELPRYIPTTQILRAAMIVADNQPKYEIGEEWDCGFACGWTSALLTIMAEIMEPVERSEPQ
jgi:hypothetical protein